MVAIAGGGYHTLALKSDGTVVAWGGDIYSYSGETNVPSNLSNVVAIAGGGYHSLALKGDGTVAAWGDDEYGETNVPANLTNVVAIAGGGYFSLALKNDGTVAAWGDDEYGETNVPSNLTNVVAISAGGDHSLALKNDGTVVAWGYGHFGQTNVPSGLTNVVAVAAGDAFSLVLKSDGTVVAWGGEPGYDSTNVPSDLTNVVSISVSALGEHSLALKSDGTVISWGYDAYGEADVPFGLTNVVAIAAGGIHSLALGHLPLSITEQPQSQIIEASGTATFGVAATGTQPINYQWYFNGTNALSGATDSTLTLTNVQITQQGFYSVTVSNSFDGIVSSNASLTLVTVPVITSETLPTNQFVIYRNSLTLSVSATAPGFMTASRFPINGSSTARTLPGRLHRTTHLQLSIREHIPSLCPTQQASPPFHGR